MFNKQKRHFKEKLAGVEKTIWDMEFKRFKTLEIREDIRKEYDNTRSKCHTLSEQIKQHKLEKKLNKAEIAKIEDQLTLLERDRLRFEEQMKAIDIEVKGAKASMDYPNGVAGINQTIDSLRELKDMLRDYIKTL